MRNMKKSAGIEVKKDKKFRLRAFLAIVLAIGAYTVGEAFASRYSGGAFFALVMRLAALALLSYAAFCLLYRLLPRFSRFCRAVWHIAAALMFAAFIVVEIIIIAHSRGDYQAYESAPSDYMIVLGAGLRGYTPSLSLASRLDKAAAQLEVKPDITVVVSGGQGPGEFITEAQAMYEYLIRKGVPAENILREDSSTNTAQNIAFSMEILRGLDGFDDGQPVIVCSNGYHLFRAKYLLNREGVAAAALSAPIPRLYLTFTGYFREFFSVMFMWRTA